MFQGTIPGDARSIVREITDGWSCRSVYVGCSGNFTIERILAESGRFSLYGNDVSLYTSILGHYLAQQPFRITLTDEYAAQFSWLAPYLADPADAVATIMLSTRMLDGLGRNNAYYERQRRAYQQQWPRLHAATVAKVRAVKVRLAGFVCGDVCDYVEQMPKDAGFCSFPPFWSGGYERLWKNLERVFDWDRPTYPELTRERIDAMFARVMQQDYWLLSIPERVPDYEPYLRGTAQTTSRAMTCYVYANGGPLRIATPQQKVDPLFAPRLLPGMAIGETLSIAPITIPQFNALRAIYLNRAIRPGSVSYPLAVHVDGVVIGALAFSNAPSPIRYDALEPYIYLMSDFAVAPTNYPRLSKLVVMALLSHEVNDYLEQSMSRRLRSVVTTAFAKHPVSMKYRGLLDLLSREETESVDIGGKGYKLQYGGALGRWSLAEALIAWKKKHGS
mgnify:CR=1 FL=1